MVMCFELGAHNASRANKEDVVKIFFRMAALPHAYIKHGHHYLVP